MASQEGTTPQRPLVFINYQTSQVRSSLFVDRLVEALRVNGVNVFDDQGLIYKTPIANIFKVIEESRIALVIFSERYTSGSIRCLEELVRIKDLVEEGKLVVFPVFYKITVTDVKHLMGKFGGRFRALAKGISVDKRKKWEEALDFVSQRCGFEYNDPSDNKDKVIYNIVEQVKMEITRISSKQIECSLDYCLSELQGDSSMDSTRSEDLKGVAREIDCILLDTKTDRDPMEADIVQPEAKSTSDDDGLSLTKDDNFLGETNSHSTDRDPMEAVIVQPDDDGLNLTKDDNFLDETNSHSTVVELPPNHQILRYGFLSHLVKALESYKIIILLGIIIGCLLLLFFCLQQNAYISTPLTAEGEVIDRVVENVPKVLETEILETISSEGSQKAYVDPSENIDTDTSAGSEKDKTFGIPTKQRMKELGDKLDLNKIASQLGMIIACLLLLFFCLAYISTPLTGAIDKIVENVPKENCSNSPMDGKVKPPNIQVFINFRGQQLRTNFVGHLVAALRGSGINVFIDNHEQRGEDLNILFKRIEDSGIAIVLFSSMYTESKWCLDELVKIQERVDQGLLKVLPIFYKVTPTNVKRLKGDFGDNFRDKEYMYASDETKINRWKEAIMFVSAKFALTFDEKSSVLESDFIENIVKEVLIMLHANSTTESGQSSR